VCLFHAAEITHARTAVSGAGRLPHSWLGSTAGEAKCPNESPVRHSRPKLAIHQAKCFASLKVMPFSSTFQAVCAAGKSFFTFPGSHQLSRDYVRRFYNKSSFIFLTHLPTPCKI
jgi:hypothetical protein